MTLHRRRQSLTVVLYGFIIAIAYAAAYQLRFEFVVPPEYAMLFAWTVLPLVALRLATFRAFRLTRERWRYASTPDVARLVAATAVGTLAFTVLSRVILKPPLQVPLSIIGIEAVLTCFLTAGLWISYRLAFEHMRRRNGLEVGQIRRVLVVGAGEAGNLLAREMLRFPTGFEPVGFVDDDSTMWGASVQGLPVIGSTQNLGSIAEHEQAHEIIIAVPSASPADLRRIVELCEGTGLCFKVLPGIREVLAGDVSLGQLREMRIEDLLGRDPIELELPELAADLQGRCVMITGAAGSIGSELARQLALHRPAKLVLFDQAETDLYYLELQLRETAPVVDIHPVIGDVVDVAALERVFRRHAPSRVFHAAAYKHVPMMELNVREAVRNNVIGTARVAEVAGRHATEKFVLVSTDKAVQPTSVMGATKRMAELVTLYLQAANPHTSYSAVRFGNVLGSSGSVIPLFRRQLADGQPLTVTHPDVTRYFMTIPEAVQLILKASLLDEMHGHIAMLDMGEPIRIADLARNLLRLTGRSGNGSSIRFVGLRPGEKLHEELVGPDESSAPTAVEKVRLLTTPSSSVPNLPALLAEWEDALQAGRDDEVHNGLAALFPALRLEFEESDLTPPVDQQTLERLDVPRALDRSPRAAPSA